jgi:hypothetical protein
LGSNNKGSGIIAGFEYMGEEVADGKKVMGH